MPTRQDHVDAVLTALRSDTVAAYSIDALPEVPPPSYIDVAVSRRLDGEQRYSGDRAGLFYRFTARVMSKTAAKAYDLWDAIDALEGVAITVGGQTTTPLQFETEDLIEPVAGRYTGVRSVTYALY